MKSIQQFNGLNGALVSREEIKRIIDLAKSEEQTEVVYRLSQIVDHPELESHPLEIIQYPSKGLNAAKHSGLYKDALDKCGRLNKGFKFVNGTVVRVGKKTIIRQDEKKLNVKIVKAPVKKTSSIKPSPSHPQAIPKATVGDVLKNKILNLKAKYNITTNDDFPIITRGLNGVALADGHQILSDDEFDLYDEFDTGLNAGAKDVEQIVNELILDKIKTGESLPPWKQSWAAKTSILAQNFETKKEYSGSNSTILNVLLGSLMPTPYYLTANQIINLGGQINKGAKSVPLVYYNFIHHLKDFSSNPQSETALLKKVSGYEVKRKGKKTVVLNKSNYANTNLTEKEIQYLNLTKNEYLSKGFLRYYRVFNVADTTGIDYELPKPKNNSEIERIELAEKIIKGFKDIPKVVEGKDATFNLQTDVITVPGIENFTPKEEYYTTLFHEMIHSTMHESRLNRVEKYKGKVDDSQYAFEELIAELGASYLAGLAGIIDVVYMNSAAYLKGWHEKLQKYTESNSDFFVFATKEAQKAVDYILQGFNENEEKTPKYSEKEKAMAKAKALKLKLKLKI